MHSEGFSRADVELLKHAPSEPVKISLIKKLHNSLRFNQLSGSERVVAQEIIRFLAADISVRVREGIATRFCNSLALPYDVAVKLANDLEDVVALPIIQNSTILAEKDLINIIEQGNIARQKAIAKRPNVSSDICSHIIQRTNPDVVTALVKNKNIKLSEHDYEVLIRRNSANQPLMRAMIASKKITQDQAYDLLTMVSSDLQKLLIVEYNIPGNVANSLIHDSKESMILNMILSNLETKNQATLEQMIHRLQADNELNFSVLIKGLSFGNLAFFETGLAHIANISLESLRDNIWGANGHEKFINLYHKCHLPEAMVHAVYKLIQIAHEEGQIDSPEAAHIYYRILNRLARTSNNEKILNLDYLVTIVAHNLKRSNLL